MQPNAYDRALQALARYNDPELLEAYKHYVARLKTILTPEELDMYARSHQHPQSTAGHVDVPSPDQVAAPDEADDEISAARKVEADGEAQALYEQYLAILGTREVLSSEDTPQSSAGTSPAHDDAL